MKFKLISLTIYCLLVGLSDRVNGTNKDPLGRYKRQFYGRNPQSSRSTPRPTSGGNQDVVMSCDIRDGLYKKLFISAITSGKLME